MHFKNFAFFVTLLVLLKPSIGDDDYNDDYDEVTQETTTMKTVIVGATTLYKTKNISAAKGSDLMLHCSTENENESASWLHIQPDRYSSITTTPNGVSILTIANVTHDSTYECKRSDKIVERFVVTVNGTHATIMNHSSKFVRKGTKMQLFCVVRSNVPVTTSYLRFKNGMDSHTFFANWESKKRICADIDYNRTDCPEETTFRYNVNATESGEYFCGCEDAESIGHFVEVISNDPIILEATGAGTFAYAQNFMVQFAIEALEKFGQTTEAATYIREKCNEKSRRLKNWNCIIGNTGYIGSEGFEFSFSPDILSRRPSSFRFSLGSSSFYLFRTNQ